MSHFLFSFQLGIIFSTSWGGFMELRDRNIYILGKILEKCALDDGKKRGIEKMVGDFYISIMDQMKLEEKKFDHEIRINSLGY